MLKNGYPNCLGGLFSFKFENCVFTLFYSIKKSYFHPQDTLATT